MKTLYITDLDGTLLTREGVVTAYTCAVYTKLLERGVLLSTATMRSHRSTLEGTAGIPWRSPLVVSGGAFIKHPTTGKPLYTVTFTPAEQQCLANLLRKMNLHPIIYATVNQAERVSWELGQEHPGGAYYISRHQGDDRFCPLDDPEHLWDGAAYACMVYGEQPALLPLLEAAQANGMYSYLQQELYREEYICEVFPAKATKAHGAKALAALLGCDRMVAFGDSENDIPLFEVADACYAVDNACETLKQMATGVIGSNEADGVARWLAQEEGLSDEDLQSATTPNGTVCRD